MRTLHQIQPESVEPSSPSGKYQAAAAAAAASPAPRAESPSSKQSSSKIPTIVQHEGNKSKWWRSCWNGNQLDGEMLYRTVKAQQEQRLKLASSTGQPKADGPLVDGSRRHSQVYSIPRRHPASPQAGAGEHTDDPLLSDPLYASILGTSKQLERISLPERHRDPARAQLRSLVERCLEVQRATSKSMLSSHETGRPSSPSSPAGVHADQIKRSTPSSPAHKVEPRASAEQIKLLHSAKVADNGAGSTGVADEQNGAVKLNGSSDNNTSGRLDPGPKAANNDRSAASTNHSAPSSCQSACSTTNGDSEEQSKCESEREEEIINSSPGKLNSTAANERGQDEKPGEERQTESTAGGQEAAMVEWAKDAQVAVEPLARSSIGQQQRSDAHAQGHLEGKEIVVDSLAASYQSPIRVRPLERQEEPRGGQEDNTAATGIKMSPSGKLERERKQSSQVKQAKRNDLANCAAPAAGIKVKPLGCFECKTSLEAQQYISVEGSQRATSGAENKREPDKQEAGAQQQPYCLKCFDRLFGESCEECGKLITCDLAVLNHEQRCWHAAPECFKCRRCASSLLGCPFLPSQDGSIYCSAKCLEAPQGGADRLSLSSPLCDSSPAPAQLGALQYQLARKAQQHELGERRKELASVSLSRHRTLIDYLLAHASGDETSCQLLAYLYAHFKRGPAKLLLHTEKDQQDVRLLDEIGAKLEQIKREKGSSAPSWPAAKSHDPDQQRQQLSIRRNKLNPFLIDSCWPTANANRATCDEANLKMMDAAGKLNQAANYINLDRILVATAAAANKQADMQNGTSANNGQQVGANNGLLDTQRAPDQAKMLGLAQQHYKASQCSPVASLVSNEGTISDHSATSSGVSTAPAVSSTNGSLESHSPLSSTSSHSSVGSGQLVSRQPASAKRPHINSVAASLERRRRVQPITELSVLDLLSTADEQLAGSNTANLVRHFESKQHQAESSKQQDFFFELAQRLPKMAGALPAEQQQLQVRPLSMPALDTNGLPTLEHAARAQPTDHYSTVNKGAKAKQQPQQVDSDFFSITSPLLTCRSDLRVPTSDTMRPTSSLSVLPVAQAEQQSQQPASGPDATSLRRNCSVQQLHVDEHQLLQLTSNKIKQAKSVSFDPTVKDPACSSASLTRASSALKSALKQSSLPVMEQQLLNTGNATMPASLANHFKASLGSLAAYNAYYDDQGRRVKLSSIVQQQQQLQQQDSLDAAPVQPSASRSLLSGALAKLNLAGPSSRGGRREERKLRQQQQLVQTVQPMSSQQHLFVQPVLMDQPGTQATPVFFEAQPSTSGFHLQHQEQLNSHQQQLCSSRRRYSAPPKSSRSSHRHQRRSSSSRHRSRSRRSRRRRRSWRDQTSDSYDSDSSTCSTCSSGSSSSSCSTCDADSSCSSEDETHSSASSSFTSSGSDSDQRRSSSSSCSSSAGSSPARPSRKSARARRKSGRCTQRTSSRRNKSTERRRSSRKDERRSKRYPTTSRSSSRSSSSRQSGSATSRRHRRHRSSSHESVARPVVM